MKIDNRQCTRPEQDGPVKSRSLTQCSYARNTDQTAEEKNVTSDLLMLMCSGRKL